MSADAWIAVRTLGLELSDQLALARGEARLALAGPAAREARLALETVTGPEAEAARTAFAALEAAFRVVSA